MQTGNLSISQLLSAGFESFKKNLSSVVVMFVGLQAIIFLLTYLLKAPFLNILMIPVIMFMQIALLKTHAAPIEKFDYEKILDLKDPGLKQKLLDLLWSYLIYVILLILLFIIPGIIFVVLSVSFNLLLLLLSLLLSIPGIIFMVYWYFFAYAVLDQKLKGMAALKKSKELISGHWWKTFAIFVIAVIISAVISSVVTSIVGKDALIGGLLMAVLSGAISIYFGYVAVAYYFDLKK